MGVGVVLGVEGVAGHDSIGDPPTLGGYFGRSQEIMRAYPYGGFAQFITAPASALVKLPDNVSFEAAARLGYFGTAYAAMKKLDVGPGRSLLINGGNLACSSGSMAS